jgi:hypothetical protein
MKNESKELVRAEIRHDLEKAIENYKGEKWVIRYLIYLFSNKLSLEKIAEISGFSYYHVKKIQKYLREYLK